ncbi:MAG: hypothetical protein ACPG5V_14360, partial [Vibrio cyclitrophicus]
LITDNSTIKTSDWSKTSSEADLIGLIDHSSDIYPDVSVSDVSYYQNGAFHPDGGFIMDAPLTYAVFRGALDFMYDKDKIEAPLRKIKKLKWKKGSWNDL